jgi:hypothetical protein
MRPSRTFERTVAYVRDGRLADVFCLLSPLLFYASLPLVGRSSASSSVVRWFLDIISPIFGSLSQISAFCSAALLLHAANPRLTDCRNAGDRCF